MSEPSPLAEQNVFRQLPLNFVTSEVSLSVNCMQFSPDRKMNGE